MTSTNSMDRSVFLLVWILFQNVIRVINAETCGKRGEEEHCEHGCCDSGANEKCCTISTSVLIVACVVSGLVFIALVASIIICCYKNYQDKRNNRVRRLQQEEAMNAPRVPGGVEPRKPPEYVSSPPVYSVEMPESHYRPVTVTGHVNSNQRFRGMTPAPQRGAIAATRTSGGHHQTNSQSFRSSQIPGAVLNDAPPAYSEFARGQTPAHRRQRFITTPVHEENNNSHNQNNDTSLSSNNNETTSNGNTVENTHLVNQRNLQNQPLRESTSSVSSISDISESNSRAGSARGQESRVASRAELQSRSETVARVLGATSRISRAQTRAPSAAPGANPFILLSGENTSDTRANETSMVSSIPGTNQRSPRRNDIIGDLSVI